MQPHLSAELVDLAVSTVDLLLDRIVADAPGPAAFNTKV
jgi:hypothetical protein